MLPNEISIKGKVMGTFITHMENKSYTKSYWESQMNTHEEIVRSKESSKY